MRLIFAASGLLFSVASFAQNGISIESGQRVIDSVTIQGKAMDEIVISGTMRPVTRMESPVPVEVYSPAFFRKNPTPNIFEALQNVNGVRPQLNCNICNTGDIHINGLEGPYTMVLIDGMPVVSSLSTVYGLSGIPNSLVERIEIVKGPASSLYGSEAVGGLINIITKRPGSAPAFSADIYTTSREQVNLDLGGVVTISPKLKLLSGVNYFNFQNPFDANHDGFTDVTLQHRISIFNKFQLDRPQNRLFTAAVRYFYEDRWGGEMNWSKKYRGGDRVYGESIYTNRTEFISSWQLPVKEKIVLSVSGNAHQQNSRYGTTSYIAQQQIAFAQLVWDKSFPQHDLLTGIAYRYVFYDDNTPATFKDGLTNPERTSLPGIFVQDELRIGKKQKLLTGIRLDHNNYHGNIFTPRVGYKLAITPDDILRFNTGTGFRVVNIFTEDHAALTGARNVVIKNALKPERSLNVNLNYLKKVVSKTGFMLTADASLFLTRFSNRITADFEADPNLIIYDNLDGYAVSKGFTLNLESSFPFGLKMITGATLMNNDLIRGGVKSQQILTEKFSGTWSISYKKPGSKFSIDYTGNVYGPMRLPLLGSLDPRRPVSRIWSIQNIQSTYSFSNRFEIYGGIKNLLNWTPAKNNAFLIARTNDPFDKNVQYNGDGSVMATPENPYALTFDPNYVYAPNEGVRAFLGLRITIR